MDSKSSLALAPQNLKVLALCIIVVLGAALALIGPATSKNHALDQRILEAQQQLDSLDQAALLQQQMNQHEGLLNSQPVPATGELEALPPDQADRIPGALQDLARLTAVQIMAISPQLDGLNETSKSMRIAASLQGPLPSLHALVTKILMLPYVENLHSLNFAAEQNALRLDVIFSVRNELPTPLPTQPAQGEQTP